MPVSSHLVPCEERDGGLPPTSAAGAGNRAPKDAQVDKTLVATGQLSAADGMRQSPRGTAGAVEHFAVIGKIAGHGTIDRAEIEPGAVGGPQVEARNRTTPVMAGVIGAGLSYRLFLAG